MKTSKKNIIPIEEFLLNYILNEKDYQKYNGEGNPLLTHDEMNLYLLMNGYKPIHRVSFSKIKKTDLLSGDIILVKDEVGKVIPYYNPRRVNIILLEQELNSIQNKKKAFKERRNYLKSIGYVETISGDVIEMSLINEFEDKITEKLNRNKKLVNKNMHGMRGKVGL